MATTKLDEPEFWLPSEFLTDEDVLPTDFPYDVGSPVESSFVGSTESDEEDCLAELTRQLTRTTLNPDFPNHFEKGWVQSGSPQSTLTGIGSWSGRSSGGSSNGSPNGSSPPTSPLGAQNDAWNLIFQAAGQVSRMEMNGGFGPTRIQGLPGPPRNSCFSNTHQARMEQMVRQQRNVMLNRCGRAMGGSGQTVMPGLSSGSGYRPGFHVESGNGAFAKKRECAGTGVFLPRRYASHNPTDTRKKPGCWLPATRVVQSMNKNINGFNGFSCQPQQLINSGFLSDYEILMARRNAMMVAAQQRRNLLLQQEGSRNHMEVGLPQEWTY